MPVVRLLLFFFILSASLPFYLCVSVRLTGRQSAVPFSAVRPFFSASLSFSLARKRTAKINPIRQSATPHTSSPRSIHLLLFSFLCVPLALPTRTHHPYPPSRTPRVLCSCSPCISSILCSAGVPLSIFLTASSCLSQPNRWANKHTGLSKHNARRQGEVSTSEEHKGS